MERLTIQTGKGAALKMADSYESEAAARQDLMVRYRVAVARLAEYEDTGMTPKKVRLISNVLQEVGETYNCWFDYVVNCVLENSHLKELAQAEKDGRLVVLPCKVGEAVDKLFSHNEIIALHIDYQNYYQRLWKGEAWRLPEQYKGCEIVRFAGFVSEHIIESDPINLVVRLRAEAEAALAEKGKGI